MLKDLHAGAAALAITFFGQIVSHAETVKLWFQVLSLGTGIALSCIMFFYYWLKVRQLNQNKKDDDERD